VVGVRAVVQRVKEARVTVEGREIGAITKGLVVFLGIGRSDNESAADYLVEKLLHLRIFEDDQGKMNRSLLESSYSMLIVSQFTLWGDCRKGRRPSFTQAAPPDQAEGLYGYFIKKITEAGITVATGQFRAMMDVRLINDGPVTILLDSDKIF
jgi:D-tyrosyl-tRNA(Tyr) deacylase